MPPQSTEPKKNMPQVKKPPAKMPAGLRPMPVPSPTTALPKLQFANCRSINKIPDPDDVCFPPQNAFLPGSSALLASRARTPPKFVCPGEEHGELSLLNEVTRVEPACVLSKLQVGVGVVRNGLVQRLRV
jgi:hypothetical protein